MYEHILNFLALIGLGTMAYFVLELFNLVYNGILYLKELREYKKEIRRAKAQIYYMNHIRRGA